MGPVLQGPDLRPFLQRVADADTVSQFREPGHHLVVCRALHQQAGPRRTALPGAREDRGGSAADGAVRSEILGERVGPAGADVHGDPRVVAEELAQHQTP